LIKIKEQPTATVAASDIGPKTPSSLVTNGSIDGSSFQIVKPELKHRLIVSVEGHEKTGKTHFAMTAPGPIALQDIDVGTEGVVEKFTHEKTIHLAEYALDFPYQQKVAEQTWKQFTNDYKMLLASQVRTGIIDNASEAWELLRLAKFGRLEKIMSHLYGPVNSEFRGLLRLAYKSDVNLILLHKVKKQYVDDQWNGKYERTGFGDIAYLVQVAVETTKKDGKFFLKVLACRQNHAAEGQIIESPTFAKLGMLVFPGTTEQEWQ
jgi:hypothetical protein